jgi:hypothetical protein
MAPTSPGFEDFFFNHQIFITGLVEQIAKKQKKNVKKLSTFISVLWPNSGKSSCG